MDEIKIENFYREYPAKPFPLYRSLSSLENERIRVRLINLLKLRENISPLELVYEIGNKSIALEKLNAENEGFNLVETMGNLNLPIPEKVYVNWYRYDSIDEIDLNELSMFFSDIWYPGADDIDIFDETLAWIISIHYSGSLSIFRF